MLKINKENIILYLLILACFTSNLSQLPFVVNLGMTQIVNIPIWILLFIYIFVFNKIYINKYLSILFIMINIIIICCFIFPLFTGNQYLNSSILWSLLTSIYIYILGLFCSRSLDEKKLKKIFLSYIISTLIVAVVIYVEYFWGKETLTSTVYAYSSKNSISQIIFTSIIILIFFKYKNFRIKNLLYIICILFQSTLLFLLRSRATIVGYLLCLGYILFEKKVSLKLRKGIFFTLFLFFIIILLNYNIMNIFIYRILFASRSFNNIDDLTSGRISILSEFPNLIGDDLFTGIGSIYFECFPLSVILNFGIFIGTIVLIISYSPIFYSIKNRKKTRYDTLFFLICIGYFFNSLFEGLAPIGPGVKCYFMWLMYGILQGREKGSYE